tara:strand:+ start:252 stop:377 length:126 start_codon:yes stop_codon:yes gene_type:complete
MTAALGRLYSIIARVVKTRNGDIENTNNTFERALTLRTSQG